MTHKLALLSTLLAGAAFLAPAQAMAQSNIFDQLPAGSSLSQASHQAKVSCAQLGPVVPGVKQTVREVAASGAIPAHCVVEGDLPTGIGFMVKLPLAWNGRLYMSGNGGYAGEDPDVERYRAGTDRALAHGFMTVRTDTGHRASAKPLASFAANRTSLVNHTYLAVHKSVQYAKQLAKAYYGDLPRYSYWDGCSTGGRQGVMSASRYPADFDGISAAAPTLDWSSIMVKGAWNDRALTGANLTTAKWQTLFASVMKQCDMLDGVKDGLIGDPRACHVDFAQVPTCSEGQDDDGCLTPLQKQRVAMIYAGPPKVAGVPAWLQQLPGVESPLTLASFVLPAVPGQSNVLSAYAESWMKWIAFKNPDYDWKTFDFTRDPPQMRIENDLYNPRPDLKQFHKRGGRMITWWGWGDTALNPQMGIDFYKKVVAGSSLADTQSFYRMFFIPGVSHCKGGYGPDVIDSLTPLIDWVEHGKAPERLKARSADDKYHRSYCAFPARTVYNGRGDVEDPKNWHCAPGAADFSAK